MVSDSRFYIQGKGTKRLGLAHLSQEVSNYNSVTHLSELAHWRPATL